MDLLFKRYASPFLLLDNYISSCRLYDFVTHLNNEQNEEMMWETWLHKVNDKSFIDFKRSLMESAVLSVKPTQKQLETTISNSKNMLDSFIPEE